MSSQAVLTSTQMATAQDIRPAADTENQLDLLAGPVVRGDAIEPIYQRGVQRRPQRDQSQGPAHFQYLPYLLVTSHVRLFWSSPHLAVRIRLVACGLVTRIRLVASDLVTRASGLAIRLHSQGLATLARTTTSSPPGNDLISCSPLFALHPVFPLLSVLRIYSTKPTTDTTHLLVRSLPRRYDWTCQT